ncbi:MAG: low-specificity L-threonine aldolase [Anaerolineae bacterium]
MKYIDLRSDTVSHPTPEMREAMANAEVGDDVYGDDPTINRLQDDAAEMFGKEGALFVASGTMGNLTSVLTHCQRGDEMILGKQTHMFMMEAGSAAAYGGIQPNTLPVQRDGTLELDAIRGAIRGENVHFPTTRLICLENTQGSVGGIPVSKEYISQVGAIARDHDLKLHIDGARIFNAATALGTTVKDLCADADSVQFCFSKGLCAPVGSMVVGSRAFIERAHRIRKSLGGGMRQAGILAAACLISLHTMSKRLQEDHDNARALAEGLAALPYFQIDLDLVQTNMIICSLSAESPLSAEEIAQRLFDDYGILTRPSGTYGFRFVTHYWIKREHVDLMLEALRTIFASAPSHAHSAAD